MGRMTSGYPLFPAVDADKRSSIDRWRPERGCAKVPKFFTIVQIAELLEVSTRTVRRWIDANLLAAHRFGGAIRIAEPDLRAFLARHRGG
jgi:excisionase family DNA binding protein